MPIKRELRWFYPIDWQVLSRSIRFGRAGGACERCLRPHGEVVRCLPDGRWLDLARRSWRDGDGSAVAWPQVAEVILIRRTRVSLATAHLDHDPGNNHPRNLRALCQRCHMLHDRPHHLARRWITYRRRLALGDLFLGPYNAASLPGITQTSSRKAPLDVGRHEPSSVQISWIAARVAGGSEHAGGQRVLFPKRPCRDGEIKIKV